MHSCSIPISFKGSMNPIPSRFTKVLYKALMCYVASQGPGWSPVWSCVESLCEITYIPFHPLKACWTAPWMLQLILLFKTLHKLSKPLLPSSDITIIGCICICSRAMLLLWVFLRLLKLQEWGVSCLLLPCCWLLFENILSRMCHHRFDGCETDDR